MPFATVLYADGKEEMFNINCKNVNFLNFIRLKCSEVCNTNDQLDLADENGECKFLFRNLEAYTSQYIGEREKLILLRVEDPKPGEKLANNCRFIPLLKSLEEDKDFVVAINPTVGQKSKTKTNPKLSVKKAMANSMAAFASSGHSTSSGTNTPSGHTSASTGSKRSSMTVK